MNKRIKEMNITRRVNKNVNTYKNVITEDTIDDVCMNIIKKKYTQKTCKWKKNPVNHCRTEEQETYLHAPKDLKEKRKINRTIDG